MKRGVLKDTPRGWAVGLKQWGRIHGVAPAVCVGFRDFRRRTCVCVCICVQFVLNGLLYRVHEQGIKRGGRGCGEIEDDFRNRVGS